jgi:molybdenum ABC transporter molybdate-binding protein
MNHLIKYYCKILLILFFGNIAYGEEPKNLTIFAESNLAVPLVKIIREYSKEKNIIISINFKSSSDLIQKIDEGEPADIFISSHQDWVNVLKQKGLIDIYTIANIAEDNLVLITSINDDNFSNNDQNLEDIFKKMNYLGYSLVTDSDDNSLGKYSNKIIKKYKIKKNRVFRKLNEDRKSIIDFLSENKKLFAIALNSSILPKDNVKIIAKISDIEINYQVSAIAGDNMELARNFIKYLEEIDIRKYF